MKYKRDKKGYANIAITTRGDSTKADLSSVTHEEKIENCHEEE